MISLIKMADDIYRVVNDRYQNGKAGAAWHNYLFRELVKQCRMSFLK